MSGLTWLRIGSVEGICERTTSESIGNEGISRLEKSLNIFFQGSWELNYKDLVTIFVKVSLLLTNQLLSLCSLVCRETESTWYIGHSVFGLLYQVRMIDDDECGVVSGMRSDRGNRSTRRKPPAVPLCLPQIPHDVTRARSRAAAGEPGD
jgi:hypothetical protein